MIRVYIKLILSPLQHTFGVFNAQLLMHKPLGCGTTAVTGAVLSTASTRAAAHFAVIVEEERVLPNLLEGAFVQIARLKFWCLEERAGVDLPLWTDTAGRGSRTADIEARQLIAEGVEMKKRVRR